MTRARLSLNPEREFDLVNFNPTNAEWTLREGARGTETIVFESDLAPSDLVEVKCDFCGRWSSDSVPRKQGGATLWMCFGGVGECAEDRELVHHRH